MSIQWLNFSNVNEKIEPISYQSIFDFFVTAAAAATITVTIIAGLSSICAFADNWSLWWRWRWRLWMWWRRYCYIQYFLFTSHFLEFTAHAHICDYSHLFASINSRNVNWKIYWFFLSLSLVRVNVKFFYIWNRCIFPHQIAYDVFLCYHFIRFPKNNPLHLSLLLM